MLIFEGHTNDLNVCFYEYLEASTLWVVLFFFFEKINSNQLCRENNFAKNNHFTMLGRL